MKEGLIISMLFAFLALIVATGNFIMALISSLSIAMIIVNVLVVVPIAGWQLGSSESVAAVICVGFSVDYVVHLASHYTHSQFSDRQDRIRESLREMGISILSGSISTILAASVLFICVVTVFTKFAIFVLLTVTMALYFSLMFFTAACAVIGPTGRAGNIMNLKEQLHEWMVKERKKRLKSIDKKDPKKREILNKLHKKTTKKKPKRGRKNSAR